MTKHNIATWVPFIHFTWITHVRVSVTWELNLPSEKFRGTELMCLPSLPRLRSQTRHIPALCLFILKICTEIKTSREKSMFLVPNLYAKNLSAPDDAKSPYEAWFVSGSRKIPGGDTRCTTASDDCLSSGTSAETSRAAWRGTSHEVKAAQVMQKDAFAVWSKKFENSIKLSCTQRIQCQQFVLFF